MVRARPGQQLAVAGDYLVAAVVVQKAWRIIDAAAHAAVARPFVVVTGPLLRALAVAVLLEFLTFVGRPRV